ncbi:MAG TPA: DUF2283 domain-containing protein [Dehalococcoidia bacterium]|nr:DUF2283 domain-containing protein [Dehalococcoidia bacterium]
MYIAYDEQGDLLHVEFRSRTDSGYLREVWGDRFVEYDDAGPLGIEFLHASAGVDLDGLPEAEAIAAALRSLATLLGRAGQPARA